VVWFTKAHLLPWPNARSKRPQVPSEELVVPLLDETEARGSEPCVDGVAIENLADVRLVLPIPGSRELIHASNV
jgi:hypothetical protein